MSEELPDWRDVYAERHAPSSWWSEERAADDGREAWRKALAARKAEQRRRRGRRQTDPYRKGRTLGVRVRPEHDNPQDSG